MNDYYDREMAKRVIKLTYFNHDMDAWAEELWEEMIDEQRAEMLNIGRKGPFIFDPNRRAILQAELDAIVAHLYGLTSDELRYILDPEDIYGPACINNTASAASSSTLGTASVTTTKKRD